MSNPTRRDGAIFLGVVPAGTVITPELIQQMMDMRPRQPFDIEATANEPLPSRLLTDEHDEA